MVILSVVSGVAESGHATRLLSRIVFAARLRVLPFGVRAISHEGATTFYINVRVRTNVPLDLIGEHVLVVPVPVALEPIGWVVFLF